jgi:hypothetical protein
VPFKYYRTFEHDSIASGASVSDSLVADENLVIKRVHLARKDGGAFTASTFFFKIGDRVFTREVAPAVVFGRNVDVTADLSIPFSKGEKLNYTFKNLEGATISIFVYFEVHSA